MCIIKRRMALKAVLDFAVHDHYHYYQHPLIADIRQAPAGVHRVAHKAGSRLAAEASSLSQTRYSSLLSNVSSSKHMIFQAWTGI
jgi:hypothetical protein